MPLGKEVGLSPGHIVLDGDPAPLAAALPHFRPMPVVATAELLFTLLPLLNVSSYFDLRACPWSVGYSDPRITRISKCQVEKYETTYHIYNSSVQ